MKRFGKLHLLPAALILLASAYAASAQIETPLREADNQPADARVSLLRELNLSNQQIRQIREINRERQPAMRQARERLRNANRALDEAIYADDASEPEIQMRLRETQLAQAEVIKTRVATETAIRRLLSPAQLLRFRELRARFAQRMENRPNRNQKRNFPLRRLGNRRRFPQ